MGQSGTGTTLIGIYDGSTSKEWKRLTEQQKMFVCALLNDPQFRPLQAAIKAGYATPHSAGTRLMKNRNVAKVLAQEQKKRINRTKLSADRLLEELAYIALRDPLDLCDADGHIVIDDLRNIPERMRRCIESIEVEQEVDPDTDKVVNQKIKLKLAPKTPALELAMKHFGMLVDRRAINLNTKVSIDWDKVQIQSADPIEEIIEVVGNVYTIPEEKVPVPDLDYTVDELLEEEEGEEND